MSWRANLGDQETLSPEWTLRQVWNIQETSGWWTTWLLLDYRSNPKADVVNANNAPGAGEPDSNSGAKGRGFSQGR